MAKISLSKILVTATAIVGACAGTYYYLSQKNRNDDDFEEFDDLDTTSTNRSYVDLNPSDNATEESVSEKVEELADTVSEKIQDGVEVASEKMEETVDAVKDDVEAVADDFKEGIHTTNVHAADKILGSAASAVENAKQIVEDAAEEVEEFFDDEDEE